MATLCEEQVSVHSACAGCLVLRQRCSWCWFVHMFSKDNLKLSPDSKSRHKYKTEVNSTDVKITPD